MDDSRIEYAQLLLSSSREELTRADSKVNVLLGTAGVGVSIIAGDIAAGHWSPASLATWAQALWWLGACVAAAGFLSLTRALAPRLYDSANKESLVYFGHVSQYASPVDLLEPLNDVSNEILEAKVSQLWSISRIVARKYALIRIALKLFAVAIVLLVAARVAG